MQDLVVGKKNRTQLSYANVYRIGPSFSTPKDDCKKCAARIFCIRLLNFHSGNFIDPILISNVICPFPTNIILLSSFLEYLTF